jgi:hypothetical protein
MCACGKTREERLAERQARKALAEQKRLKRLEQRAQRDAARRAA